jgi:hypothetical protein
LEVKLLEKKIQIVLLAILVHAAPETGLVHHSFLFEFVIHVRHAIINDHASFVHALILLLELGKNFLTSLHARLKLVLLRTVGTYHQFAEIYILNKYCNSVRVQVEMPSVEELKS